MKQSGLFLLGWADLGKGLIVAILGAVIGLINGWVMAGQFTFNWPDVWHAALTAGVAYLFKNLMTNDSGQILTANKK